VLHAYVRSNVTAGPLLCQLKMNETQPLLPARIGDVATLVALDEHPRETLNSTPPPSDVFRLPSVRGAIMENFKSRLFWRSLLAEGIGTAVLLAVGLGTVASANRNLLLVDLSFVGVLLALILMFDTVSGAHFNPAISTGMWLQGALPLSKLPFYILAQLFGASVACCYLLVVIPAPMQVDYFGVTRLGDGVTLVQAVVIEMTLTGALMLAVLALGVQPARKNLRSPFIAPVGVCCVVLSCMFFGAPLTGASMNPARSFGPALVLGYWENHWVYWVGPVGGAAVAVVLARVLYNMNE